MRLRDLLIVLVDYFSRDTFHAEDFNLETLTAGVGVLHMREVFLVHLVHVHRETWTMVISMYVRRKREAVEIGVRTSSRVQSSPTTVAFEMFGFLVRDENLQVVKVALAVVAPWSLELLVQVWVSLALLRHGGDWDWSSKRNSKLATAKRSVSGE